MNGIQSLATDNVYKIESVSAFIVVGTCNACDSNGYSMLVAIYSYVTIIGIENVIVRGGSNECCCLFMAPNQHSYIE